MIPLRLIPLCLPCLLYINSNVAAAEPTVLDPDVVLEVFAEAPQIVTPTGATVDDKGRLLVIESHTHQRPADYRGPKKDRILLVLDTDRNGRADKFQTFFEGTEATMSIRSGSDGWIYVATRMEVFRIRDTNGDDRANQRETIAHLETKGNYPHNGLSGLAFDGQGHLLFGMGENLGVSFRLVGRDGAAQRGSGEGGIFQCDLDGSDLKRIATGFWNPFGICVDQYQRVFAVGNDADGRPPCRLVHVVETGDYGFQFRYGRSGRHPLQAWDGELPGTLPMVTGTGEAPCEIIPFRGKLWVSVWGDYRIERYELIPRGASFDAQRDIVIQGDETFRPVAFAPAPNGDLYFTDWVDKSYPVHRQGRIWRLRFKQEPSASAWPKLSAEEQQARRAATAPDRAALDSNDVFLRQNAVLGLTRSAELESMSLATAETPRERLSLLQALRWKLDHAVEKPARPPIPELRAALSDPNPDVRLLAVRWVADAELKELRGALQQQLAEHENTTPHLFRATIAALELLDTGETSFDAKNTGKYFWKTVQNQSQPVELRRLALRLAPPKDVPNHLAPLDQLFRLKRPQIRREVVRTLALSGGSAAETRLTRVLHNADLPDQIRADALAGLARQNKISSDSLQELTGERNAVAEEARRLLRSASGTSEEQPSVRDTDAWLDLIGQGGDVDAGWRVFFGKGNVSCAQCHQLQGRGEDVGPELTGIAARTSRKDVLESILQPSRDIAPQFVPTQLELTDGRILQGLKNGYDAEGVRERFLALDGSVFSLSPDQIAQRRAAKVSIMPANIHETLSLEELRNLLALLEQN